MYSNLPTLFSIEPAPLVSLTLKCSLERRNCFGW